MSSNGSRDISLQELLERALENRIAEIYTTMPGKVVSYDSAKRRADIEVQIRRVIKDAEGNDVEEELPILPSVPVEFPGGGGCYVTWPIEPGDTGVVEIKLTSITEWMQSGRVSTPRDQRLHHPSAATFRPGLLPNGERSQTSEDAYIIDTGEAQKEIRLVSFNAAAFIARADRTLEQLQNIVTAFNTHIHPAGSPPGNTGMPTATMPDPGPVACDKVKGV